mmetsp:Transcript_28418/g.70999  ORF Transcript_28418/g.70999 Transcript_28418/m.70999 type:complete len:86 (+) Transcript_28418:266-523(+)
MTRTRTAAHDTSISANTRVACQPACLPLPIGTHAQLNGRVYDPGGREGSAERLLGWVDDGQCDRSVQMAHGARFWPWSMHVSLCL